MNGFDRNLLSLDIYIDRNLSSQLLKHIHSCVLSLYFTTKVTSVQQKRRVYCSATYFKFKDKNKKEEAASTTKRAQNQEKASHVPNRVVISKYTVCTSKVKRGKAHRSDLPKRPRSLICWSHLRNT